MKHILILLPLLFAMIAHANVATEQFEAANKLYEEKKFAEAAAAYEKIVQSGVASPALWFNLGNAEFKAGRIGRAIAAYRRAEALTPRDPDVRANLRFSRNHVSGPTYRLPTWRRWMANGFSVNEWSLFSAIGIWLTFLCLAAAKFQPSLKPLWFPSAKIFGALTIFQIIGLSLALIGRSPEIAIVTAQQATIRNGPLEESASAFTVNDGSELRVLDKKDEWLQVTDGTRRIGWLKRGEVALFNALR